ncbi:MAG: FHA domain-containing protein, partial [Anaerolineae bacterium]
MDILLLVLRLALAGVLYAFLAAILLMLWRDLQQAAAHREPAQHAGHLVVVQTAGEEAEEPAVGALLPLRPVTSIGRSPGNTIVIPDTYASSQHALLTWREGQWWLADQNSRNGT